MLIGLIFLFLQSLTPIAPFMDVGGCGTRHNKRRLLRFGFGILKSWENFNRGQKQSNVDVPWVCYSMPYFALQVLVYPYTKEYVGIVMVYVYISAWGFGVARFDYDGQFSGASGCEASKSTGLHVFFGKMDKK